MSSEQTNMETTNHNNVVTAMSHLNEAVMNVLKRDRIITSLLLNLPEHTKLKMDNERLKQQLKDLGDVSKSSSQQQDVDDHVKITIKEKLYDTTTLTSDDIRKVYGAGVKNSHIPDEKKTVTASFGALTLNNVSCTKPSLQDAISEYTNILNENDPTNFSADPRECYQTFIDEFSRLFAQFCEERPDKSDVLTSIPFTRTNQVSLEKDDEESEDNEDDDDDEDVEYVYEDASEDDEEEEDDDDEEEDEEEDEDDDSSEDEEETSIDNVDAVANNWDEKEHNRVVQGDKDEEGASVDKQDERERLQGVEEQEAFFKEKYNSKEGEDLSEEEEDDGTTVSDDEQSEDDDSEEDDEEISSEELVVCEMEDEDGNPLEYLTNDPEEMNGDIFELLDGDEVGKKIGRFVNGEPEFFE